MKQITLTFIVAIIFYVIILLLAHNFDYLSIKDPLYWIFVVLPMAILGFNISNIYKYFSK